MFNFYYRKSERVHNQSLKAFMVILAGRKKSKYCLLGSMLDKGNPIHSNDG